MISEVELAHAGDDDLSGLLIGADAEGGVLGHQLAQPLPQFLLVGLGFGLDGE